MGIAAASGVMVFTGLRLVMQMKAMQAAAPTGISVSTDMALDGLWGTGWWLEVAGAAAALGALAIPALSRVGWRIALLACVGAIAVGQAMGGHAAAATNLNTAIALDALHLLAAGAWIGGIAAIAAAALPSLSAIRGDLRGPGAVLLLRLFSPLALSGASVLLLSGVYEAYLRIGSLAALVQSSYGRALLIKVALVAATAGLGALNWRRLSVRANDVAGVHTLQRSVRLELVVAALVLLVTSVLMALPTPVE
jgi:copper transport protein